MAPLPQIFGAQDANLPALSTLKQLSTSPSRKPIALGELIPTCKSLDACRTQSALVVEVLPVL